MSRESFVFVLGFIIFFTSFLGVPSEWKEKIFIVGGILLMVVGYNLRRTAFLRSLDQGTGERKGDAFVESAHISQPQPTESFEVKE